ncbi:MAG: zinc-dependent peptidase, partial [Planctomycetota bacterium]
MSPPIISTLFGMACESGIKRKSEDGSPTSGLGPLTHDEPGESMFGLRKRRRRRLAARPFPDEWLAIINRNVPFYRLLPAEDRAELQRHIL